MKHAIAILAFIGALGAFNLALAQKLDNDTRIISGILAIDRNQIQIARVAEDKNIDKPLIAYAWMIDLEHQKNLYQAKQLAKRLGLRPPFPQHRRLGVDSIETLAPLDQDTFSREFIWEMVREDAKILAWIDAQQPRNQYLRSFLVQTSMDVRLHLKKAQSIQEQVLR